MAETEPFSLADSIRDARQRVEQELRAQAERFEKLNTELTELRQLHERTEQEAAHQWDEVARAAELAVAKAAEVAAAQATELANAHAAELAAQATELANAHAAELVAQAVAAQVPPDKVLEDVLGAVRNLMTCTIPEQVLEVLTEEASQWGVRAAIFDVRGKAAWGASAHGFGPALTEKVLRSLVVPLNQDNPFRQVCETAGHVDASPATLKKNRNVLDKFKPAPHGPVLLLPVRSAGSVSAILYTDPGEKGDPLPVNALKILAEFAGAQIDRLIALSGGLSAEGVEEEVVEAAEQEAPVQEAEAPAAEPAPAEIHAEEPAQVQPRPEEPAVQPPVVEETVAEVHAEAQVAAPPAPEPEPPSPPVEVAVEPPAPAAPLVESEPAPPVVEPPVEVVHPPAPVEPPPPVIVAESAPPPAPVAPAGFDVTQLSEAEQKVHKDAKRFARLLVTEIELYNKAKVADGRKNRDLYKRLKSDIDRSRQTYEKRFGKALGKQIDYLHEELVKTLAANDSSVLGPEYPGPSA